MSGGHAPSPRREGEHSSAWCPVLITGGSLGVCGTCPSAGDNAPAVGKPDARPGGSGARLQPAFALGLCP